MTIRHFGIMMALVTGFGLVASFLIFSTVTSLIAPANGQITESAPNWVPRVKGSTGTPVQAGECGQATIVVGGYVSWHKIECPK
jgi:hypothetical protein